MTSVQSAAAGNLASEGVGVSSHRHRRPAGGAAGGTRSAEHQHPRRVQCRHVQPLAPAVSSSQVEGMASSASLLQSRANRQSAAPGAQVAATSAPPPDMLLGRLPQTGCTVARLRLARWRLLVQRRKRRGWAGWRRRQRAASALRASAAGQVAAEQNSRAGKPTSPFQKTSVTHLCGNPGWRVNEPALMFVPPRCARPDLAASCRAAALLSSPLFRRIHINRTCCAHLHPLLEHERCAGFASRAAGRGFGSPAAARPSGGGSNMPGVARSLGHAVCSVAGAGGGRRRRRRVPLCTLDSCMHADCPASLSEHPYPHTCRSSARA